MEQADFTKMSPDEAIGALHSDRISGLSGDEAVRRLKERGYNEVPERKESSVLMFLGKFWGVTAWMLELIIVLSYALGNLNDLYIVTALLVFNAVIGFVQERRARNAVETLKKRLQVNSRALRQGAWVLLPARELVPGDIVRLRAGDFVPADLKMLDGAIGADQSSVTGESEQMDKEAGDIVYSGSIVGRGEAEGLVVATGASTFFGKTAQLVQIARPKLHIEDVVARVSRWLLIIVAVLLGIALAVSLAQGTDLLEILPLMLVLLLGAVPVALPAMFTISMAIGSMELVRKGVLVTRLSAPDDAASMDILCVDKTGTITMNRLSITEVLPQPGRTKEDVLLFGALASEEANQDAIDSAFIAAARGGGLLDGSYLKESFTPFDPKTRRTEAVVRKGKTRLRIIKGAVSVISSLCGIEGERFKLLEEQVEGFASKGFRTLAVASAAGGEEPRLAGIVAMHDPLRPDSKELVGELRELGVSVKLLTGDAAQIGREIGEEAGIGGDIIKVSHLKGAPDVYKAAGLAEKADGFSEIYPGDKYDIVKSLQESGHVVGMTGDGVNDAPALRQAEVGIAVSSATDVAKGAASVVLTEAGLTNIVEPIRTGRLMFRRINTWILNKITRTVLKTVFIVLAFLLTGRFIVSSSAVLLMIFMTDFVKLSLSTDNVMMSKKPDVWRIRPLVKVSLALGLVMVAEAFALLYLGDRLFGVMSSDATLHTFSFEILFFFAMFSVFLVRERGHFWDSAPSAIFLGAVIADMAIAVAIASVGALGISPLPPAVTAFVIAYSFLIVLVLNDFIKIRIVDAMGWR